MENASKALIMAGTVLISLMVISIGVYIVNMFGDYTSNQEKQREMQQIAEFNAQFLKYEGRTDITAQDIVSVANLAKANNELYELTKSDANSANPKEQGSYYITIKVTGTIVSPTDGWKKEDGVSTTLNNLEECVNKEDFLMLNSIKANKIQHYNCEKVIVSDITKRVSKIILKTNDIVDE